MSTINLNFGYVGTPTDFNFEQVSSSDNDLNFSFGEGTTIYKILYGKSNNFNSIWVNEKASLNNHTLYISRPNDLTIINTKNKEANLKDYYSKTSGGRLDQTLNAEDQVDLNVI
jgi:hypothetical protein